MFTLQKWAIRRISNSYYRSHTGPPFSKYNALLLMYTILLSSILVYRYLCINITQSFQHILLNMFKHTDTIITQQEMPRIRVLIKPKKMFSDSAIRNYGPTFQNPLDKTIKQSKTIKHFRNR